MNKINGGLLGLFLLLTACTSVSKPETAALQTQLSVNSVPGRLKAKLVLKNMSGKEIVLNDLNSKNFKVETLDGKPMPFRGAVAALDPVTVAPGEAKETAFQLQDSYPFWDRRTKYKIWYDSPAVKSNIVQVWF